ncbi:MAG: TetR/AcrR family transcriptional regulator [Caulobacteraceae bacterium]
MTQAATAEKVRRGPNAVRRASTRDKILKATIQCLAEHGYAETSTPRVTRLADVSRGSLLHQFPAKVDLIIAAAEYAAARMGERNTAAIGAIPRGRGRFIGVVDAFWDTLQSPESIALLEIMLAARNDRELAQHITKFAAAFEKAVDQSARRFAAKTGLKDEDGESETLARVTRMALRGLLIETMLSGERAKPADVIDFLKAVRADFHDRHS